jgi:glutamine amidotransferase
MTEYGITFPSICGRDNIVGVQFHPEKSQASGLKLLKNFAEI